MTDHSVFRFLFIGLIVVGFLAGGAIAGAIGRRWLRGLRRGAVFRPPWCEVAVAAAWAVLGWRWLAGLLPGWWLPVPLLLAWFGVLLAAVDLAHRRLPDAVTLTAYPALGIGLIAAALFGPRGGLGLGGLVGAMAFGGAHAVVHFVAPRSLGRGDVKLAGSLGAVLGALGWPALVLATVLASLITVGLALFAGRTGLRSRLARRTAPHGPGLLIATWLMAAFPGAGFAAAGLASGGLLAG
ncbi:MAG TPA: A24 family peptidase [Pseudonocardiaceae bacterium]|jgi:leader peptidase (prepilin peptidase)/N-methyltransferase|nr:A24 family peptidase [Pseudonocardiaceae bacterium]